MYLQHLIPSIHNLSRHLVHTVHAHQLQNGGRSGGHSPGSQPNRQPGAADDGADVRMGR